MKMEEKKYFYTQRDRFNEIKSSNYSGLSLEQAALFIFLNRTCFNGLYRVNRKGHFNVPIGSYKQPMICDKENLMNISRVLQKVKIVCGDYRKSIDFIDDKTFVYLDPPYRPLSTSSSFTAYTEDGFDDQAQIELAEFIQYADKKGAKLFLAIQILKTRTRTITSLMTFIPDRQSIESMRLVLLTAKLQSGEK